MTLETVDEHRSHGGTQGVYRHASDATGTDMTFAVFVPDHAEGERLPVLWYLSGLTCTHANVVEKGEYRAACAAAGVILVAPDTSPRGDGVADDDAYDLGQGAGFYLDATQEPWAPHYRMRSYIEDELPALVAEAFPADLARQAIDGHSMGGHGAFTTALRHPDRFRSVGAFSPIANPGAVPWGEKAFTAYLGEDRAAWRAHDAVAMLEDGARFGAPVRVDFGTADPFLEEQLTPDRLAAAWPKADIRLREGYDHSYFFVSTFMAERVAWHAAALGA